MSKKAALTLDDLDALVAELQAALPPVRFAALAKRLQRAAASARAAPPPKAPESFPDRCVLALGAILARADEKAGLLLDALAAAGHPVQDLPIRGLKPTIARLTALLGEDSVWAGVESVLAQARAFGALRETVV
jgi:hypothetical protein